MEKVDYAGLGRRIRYFRKRRGLTQEELANLVELTQKHISNIECAHSIPTLQTFVKISNCLQVPPAPAVGRFSGFFLPRPGGGGGLPHPELFPPPVGGGGAVHLLHPPKMTGQRKKPLSDPLWGEGLFVACRRGGG